MEKNGRTSADDQYHEDDLDSEKWPFGKPDLQRNDFASIIADLDSRIASLKEKSVCDLSFPAKPWQERIEILESEKRRLLANPDLIRREYLALELNEISYPFRKSTDAASTASENRHNAQNPIVGNHIYSVGSVIKANPNLQKICSPAEYTKIAITEDINVTAEKDAYAKQGSGENKNDSLEEKDSLKKKYLQLITYGFFILIAIPFGSKIIANQIMTPDVASLLKKESTAENKNLPLRVDAITTLVSTSTGPGMTFTYHYIVDLDIDLFSIDKITEKLLKISCSYYEDNTLYKRYGVALVYSYKSAVDAKTIEVVLTPERCGFY